MSRKLLTVAALILLAVPGAPSVARAQISYSVAAGATKALGQLGSDVDIGYHAAVSVSFSPPLAPIGFCADGMYTEFNYKSASAFAAGSKARIISVAGNAVMSSSGHIAPYVIGGLGLYRLSVSPADSNSSEVDIGANIGAGVRIGFSGFSAYGEARYHYVGNNKYQMIPITFGVTF